MTNHKKQKNSLPLDRVYHDNVLIKPIRKQEAGDGIIMPHSYDDKAEWGEVVLVGPGKKLENGELLEPSATVGEVVFFQKYSVIKLRHEGIDYLLLRDEDIYGVQ